ncbi:early nodulin-like protein 14 [Gastrolobium bilobum]|uniref:early nodulin-like protein 14 n=1 Tax=Gastrolobium bilobum TaxID=150636 RepID=UPI002AB1192A|nr:early nodulin-like protein 14 [Gastrolobium bilobum]
MAFRNNMKLVIMTLVVCALLQNTDAEKVHVVGGDLGWRIPLGVPIVYDAWASLQDFNVGDILLFNFTNGEQDVARVTKEAYLICNTTNPISLKKTSPANFTLDTAGDYYFISTLDQHCLEGQKLAIHVHGSGPSPAPRGLLNYTVGDKLGWLVPPGGEIAYATWAYGKTFIIGDSLVFYYLNGTQDVAVVTKEAYEKCETNNTLAVYTSSPTRIILKTTGEHFFTSTYKHHCALGQKLAINVTSFNGTALSPESALSPTYLGPSTSAPAPFSSAPSMVICGYMVTLLSIGLAFII